MTLNRKKSYIIERDTLKNPPNYDGKFVLTNPPMMIKKFMRYIKQMIYINVL